MSETRGPMGLANQEIRDAIDQFATERRAQRRLPALLERTDTILNELESLNLIQVRRTPRALRSDLATLVADLPFDYTPPIGPRPSPAAAIDVVFGIQEGIFRLMFEPLTDAEPLEVAS